MRVPTQTRLESRIFVRFAFPPSFCAKYGHSAQGESISIVDLRDDEMEFTYFRRLERSMPA